MLRTWFEIPLWQRVITALILGVDRILDMLRTTTNVTGDAAVCAVIAHSEKQLHPPSE